jgi:hypothetical protein
MNVDFDPAKPEPEQGPDQPHLGGAT